MGKYPTLADLKVSDEVLKEDYIRGPIIWASDAHPVNVAESSSPMPGLSPKQEPEASQILQDLVKAVSEIAVQTYRMEHKLMEMQDQVFKLLTVIEQMAAEDQDPDEMPAMYLDGKPVL